MRFNLNNKLTGTAVSFLVEFCVMWLMFLAPVTPVVLWNLTFFTPSLFLFSVCYWLVDRCKFSHLFLSYAKIIVEYRNLVASAS